MKGNDKIIFIGLFKAACEKCFGHPMDDPLSETDCRQLSNDIFSKTGLVIGIKSIKNYSIYVCDPNDGKQENPSIASLDTLSRYVMDAPITNETNRKLHENHHPYWFQYRRKYIQPISIRRGLRKQKVIISILVLVATTLGILLLTKIHKTSNTYYHEGFNSVVDSLSKKGWKAIDIDTEYWEKRGDKKGFLTLYTLKGDNWSEPNSNLSIKNLLMKRFDVDCFVAEIHFFEFFPTDNWQQVGIIISEDSTFRDKVVRFSISYNDFFGGYERPPEIILQGVSSAERNLSKPEEFLHHPLFVLEKGKENLVRQNMQRASLRIEKKNQFFRFLYTTGFTESFAYNESGSKEISIEPKYIGIFAMKGLSETGAIIPVQIDSFLFNEIECGN